jgi:hypothetical protein
MSIIEEAKAKIMGKNLRLVMPEADYSATKLCLLLSVMILRWCFHAAKK